MHAFEGGLIWRKGSVPGCNTVSDYHELEKDRELVNETIRVHGIKHA